MATRREVDQLLLDKLSDALTPEQKVKKIANLLTKLLWANGHGSKLFDVNLEDHPRNLGFKWGESIGDRKICVTAKLSNFGCAKSPQHCMSFISDPAA